MHDFAADARGFARTATARTAALRAARGVSDMICPACDMNATKVENADGTEKWFCEIHGEIDKKFYLGVENTDKIVELAGSLLSNSPEDQYRELIEAFMEDNPIFYDSKTGIFWLWNADAFRWQMAEETDILRLFLNRYAIIRWLLPAVQSKVLEALKVFAQFRPKDLPPDWVQFCDMMINITTGDKMAATAEYFTTNPIPWPLGESEDTPTIDRLFMEWVGEAEKQKLYELCAYCLLRGYPLHRMFFLIGVGRNGKGTFFALLAKFIGEDNCTTTDLATLNGSRFESARLQNKLVCGISELNVGIFRDTVLLKRMVGGDLLRGEYKGKALFDFFNYAKVVIMTNTLPETADKSDGWYSRYIPIEFPNQFDLGKDRDVLAEVPDVEYEALAVKSVRILRELLHSRQFIGEGNIAEKRERYESKADLLNRFVSENYEPSTMDEVPKFEFQDEFEAWCRQKNVMAWSAVQVNKALREMGYSVEKRSFRDETTGNARNWQFVMGLRKM
jgi:P4 family phage/plasmid primase-like protien